MPQGDVLSMNPLGKCQITPRPLPRGADDRGQHGRKHMAQSLAPARIGNLLKMFQQTPSGSRIQSLASVRKRLRKPTPSYACPVKSKSKRPCVEGTDY